MALPQPVLSSDNEVVVRENSYKTANMIWNTWSEGSIEAAVLRAVLSCQMNLGLSIFFAKALSQNKVCFLHSFSLEVEEIRN